MKALHINLFLCALSFLCKAHNDIARKDALTVVDDKSGENQKNNNHNGEAAQSFKEELSDEIFYPTKEWQTIKPGQAIPQGLHVRMNLETGVKEAKLMDGDDGFKFWKKGERVVSINTKHKYFTHDELKNALKTIKSDGPKQEKVEKKKFRSLNELKDEFSKLNVNFKTDAEIIVEFIKRFNADDTSSEEKEKILHDLEYYLHQYDNAQDFVKLGGLSLLMRSLNATEESIRREAAFALGSATQGNPKVQIAAIESGALQQLLRMLALEENDVTQSRVLYALSCLLRHFPVAQERFIQLGGFSTLSKIFNQPQTNKLVVKIITLVNDLITERHLVTKHSSDDDTNKEKLRQYSRIHLENAILEHGWCQVVPPLLEIQDHDAREKILQAMISLVNVCQSDFLKKLPQLNILQAEYRDLITLETQNSDINDDFFTSLHSLIESLVTKLTTIKDEL